MNYLKCFIIGPISIRVTFHPSRLLLIY